MKTYISFARWPVGSVPFATPPDWSSDTHETREQAQGVVDLLKKNGLGGEGKIFPIQAWIEPIPVPSLAFSDPTTVSPSYLKILERDQARAQEKYLIWSNDRGLWWRPNAWGYTRDPRLAGRFSLTKAVEIVTVACVAGFMKNDTPQETIFPESALPKF